MSATATESPPTRRCPQCAAPMAPEQDWCLECGTAVTTRVRRAPGWGVPVAIVAVVLALAGAAVFLIADHASNQSDQAAGTQGATGPPYHGPIPVWRADTRAYTLVAFTSHSRGAAEARARRLVTAGERAGVLRTTGYAQLPPGVWVTWSGQYADVITARRAAPAVRALFPATQVRLIRRAARPRPAPSTPASTPTPAPAPGQ